MRIQPCSSRDAQISSSFVSCNLESLQPAIKASCSPTWTPFRFLLRKELESFSFSIYELPPEVEPKPLYNLPSDAPSVIRFRSRTATLSHQLRHLRSPSSASSPTHGVQLKWLPRLTRTTFETWGTSEELPLSFGHVPLLEVLTLKNTALYWHKMVNLSTLLSETPVQDLRLGFTGEKIWVQPEFLTRKLSSAFHRLRTLCLYNIPEEYDLRWTMFILEAAPSLEEFYMLVMDHPCEMEMDEEKRRELSYVEEKGVEWESANPNFKHHRLTKLIIFCFESKPYMGYHVMRVMKAAVNLQDVYLYNRLTCRRCNHLKKPTRFPKSEKQRRADTEIMNQDIESPARVHFLNPDEMSPAHDVPIPRFFTFQQK
ncbi:unnamed protein product [Alopecurus aequalis]